MSAAAPTPDAYTRIALRLRELSGADRAWLLSQLAGEDCRRVSDALQKYRAESASRRAGEAGAPLGASAVGAAAGAATSGAAAAGEAAGAAGARGGPDGKVHPSREDGAITRLKLARPNDVKQLLGGQPNWVIALILATQQWPWTPELLGSLGPERTRALRALAHELRQQVKPAFRARILQALAAGVDATPGAAHPAQSPFDIALEQAALDALNEIAPGERVRRDPT
jgi:hypothetical protein